MSACRTVEQQRTAKRCAWTLFPGTNNAGFDSAEKLSFGKSSNERAFERVLNEK